MDIEKFIAENAPNSYDSVGAGKLEARKEEILALHARNFSLQQIVNYLTSVGVGASRAGVSKLIRRETQVGQQTKSSSGFPVSDHEVVN